ncbi:hypothetical protein QYM36_013220 [Artemia franciscana]|uniref:Uncharacterized protein n=1 Tax=Artemia franciscana TaxID=6661 RepID=A0AA88HI92_ARTSF|nr:hypothetical protein QYM36_013220 [Artemia franciscana]
MHGACTVNVPYTMNVCTMNCCDGPKPRFVEDLIFENYTDKAKRQADSEENILNLTPMVQELTLGDIEAIVRATLVAPTS